MKKNYLLLLIICLGALTLNVQAQSFTFVSKGTEFTLHGSTAVDGELSIRDEDGKTEKIEIGTAITIEAGKKYTVTGNITDLDLSYNRLSSLDVSGLTKLKRLDCYKNNFTDCALDELFNSLPQRTEEKEGAVYIANYDSNRSPYNGCNTTIANGKKWKVYDWQLGSDSPEIKNTTFTCVVDAPSFTFVSKGTVFTLREGTAADGELSIIYEDGKRESIIIGRVKYIEEGIKHTVTGNITKLIVDDNQLSSLDVSGLTALEYLDCYNNALSSLDVSGLTALEYLDCHSNALTYLDVSGLKELTELNCGDNALTTLDVSGLPALKELYCNNNALTALDVSGLPALIVLYCYDNPSLSSLDVSGLTALKELYCNNNALTALDVSGLTALTKLYCNNNALTALDVSGLPALTDLYCESNALTALDVSGLPALTDLYCESNALTALDVSGLTSLKILNCPGNALSSLDVSGLPALTRLYCDGNALTSLTVSGLTALEILVCDGNALSSLTVSGLTSLTYLNCANNALAALDVSALTALKELRCYKNNFTVCALDALFNSLPQRTEADEAKVYIANQDYDKDPYNNCNTPIANRKNWKVMSYGLGYPTEITNSTFGCTTVSEFCPPENVRAELIGQNQVKLSWEKGDCGGATTPTRASTSATGYNVYRDAQLLTAEPITALEYIDSGVSAGSHSYTVRAVYAGGQESVDAPAVTVTTTAVLNLQNENYQLLIYPNPLMQGQELTIKHNINPIDYADASIEIYSLLGVCIEKIAVNNPIVSVRLKNKGSYLLRLNSKHFSTSKMLIVR